MSYMLYSGKWRIIYIFFTLSLFSPFSPFSSLSLSVAGISVTEHLEINVVPLAVRLTEKLYQTIQSFFLPKAETEAKDTSEPDHSHVFGVQRK